MLSSKFHKNKYKLQSPYLEKHLQGKICRWWKDNKKEYKELLGSIGEVKLVTGGTLAFSKFEDQQLPSLYKASHEGLYHKLTDASLGFKPADFFIAKDGFIFCQFWKNNQQEIAYYMNIRIAMKIKKAGMKSLKEQDFMLLGETINLEKYK